MSPFLQNVGVSKDDSPELRLKKYTVLLISSTCCIATPIWSAIYYFVGLPVAALGPVIYFFTVFPAILYFLITKNEKPLVDIQLFSIFFCPTMMQVSSGGFTTGGVVILWSFLAPLTALLFYDIRKARLWITIIIACIFGIAFFDNDLASFGHPISRTSAVMLLSMNLIGPITAIYFGMQYFVHTLTKNSKLLTEEKAKSDRLLLNILPRKVAEELKITGSASPTKFTSSTVLFTDFTDFTKISELLTPEELINELDTCFKCFDDIVSAHGLEKIKTVGDAYLCAAGIPADIERGACQAVLAALKMAEYINEVKEQRTKVGKPFWGVRIGLHSGEVVAGIVGKDKFAYDIWGDAVNVASRMESSGEEGKVNISGVTYNLVQDYFDCVYRGKIHAKNKGQIDMYFVEGANNKTNPVLATAS